MCGGVLQVMFIMIYCSCEINISMWKIQTWQKTGNCKVYIILTLTLSFLDCFLTFCICCQNIFMNVSIWYTYICLQLPFHTSFIQSIFQINTKIYLELICFSFLFAHFEMLYYKRHACKTDGRMDFDRICRKLLTGYDGCISFMLSWKSQGLSRGEKG